MRTLLFLGPLLVSLSLLSTPSFAQRLTLTSSDLRDDTPMETVENLITGVKGGLNDSPSGNMAYCFIDNEDRVNLTRSFASYITGDLSFIYAETEKEILDKLMTVLSGECETVFITRIKKSIEILEKLEAVLELYWGWLITVDPDKPKKPPAEEEEPKSEEELIDEALNLAADQARNTTLTEASKAFAKGMLKKLAAGPLSWLSTGGDVIAIVTELVKWSNSANYHAMLTFARENVIQAKTMRRKLMEVLEKADCPPTEEAELIDPDTGRPYEYSLPKSYFDNLAPTDLDRDPDDLHK